MRFVPVSTIRIEGQDAVADYSAFMSFGRAHTLLIALVTNIFGFSGHIFAVDKCIVEEAGFGFIIQIKALSASGARWSFSVFSAAINGVIGVETKRLFRIQIMRVDTVLALQNSKGRVVLVAIVDFDRASFVIKMENMIRCALQTFVSGSRVSFTILKIIRSTSTLGIDVAIRRSIVLIRAKDTPIQLSLRVHIAA